MNRFYAEKSRFRHRVLLHLSFILGVLAVVGGVLSGLQGASRQASVAVVVVSGVCFLLLSLSIRRSDAFTPFAAHGILLTLLVGTTATALLGKGFLSAIIASFLIVPVFSTFLLGHRGGALYTGLTMLAVFGIYAFDRAHLLPQHNFTLDELRKSQMLSYSVLLVVVFMVSFAFDHNRQIMERGLMTLNASLEQEKHRAEQSLAIKTRFLANMSHEIRTPMNGILGMATLLRGTAQDPAMVEKLEIIETSGKLLLGIIDDILDFSKLEAGRMSIERIPVHFPQLVREAADLTRAKAQEKHIQVVENVSQTLPAFVLGDPIRLKQIMLNLLGNAIKFSSEKPVEIRVSTVEEQGDRLTIQVSVIDRGIGIDRVAQGELFRPFSQADLSTTRKYGGTGLGLALCKSFVELMGGRIWVDSEIGAGSTFSFVFPTQKVTADVQAQRAEGALVGAPVIYPIAVLVAEDNQINRTVVDGILRKLGYHADFVTTGAQALQAANRKVYDIILMDCHMPEMDGFEATIRIRQLPQKHRPLIVALTASVMKEERERCQQAGMDGFLAKPLQIKDLKQLIEAYAKAQQLQPIAYKMAT